MNYAGLKSKQSMVSYSITITIIATIISGLFGFLLAILIMSNEMVHCITNQTCSFIDQGVVNDYLSAIQLSTMLAGSIALVYAIFIALIVYNSSKQDMVNKKIEKDLSEKSKTVSSK